MPSGSFKLRTFMALSRRIWPDSRSWIWIQRWFSTGPKTRANQHFCSRHHSLTCSRTSCLERRGKVKVLAGSTGPGSRLTRSGLTSEHELRKRRTCSTSCKAKKRPATQRQGRLTEDRWSISRPEAVIVRKGTHSSSLSYRRMGLFSRTSFYFSWSA